MDRPRRRRAAVDAARKQIPGRAGRHLAANYPGDRGVDNDPKVIFAENFEEPTPQAMQQRWEDVSHPEIMSFAADVPEGSGGKQSLLMTHVGGKGNGGHLYRRLPQGLDKRFRPLLREVRPRLRPDPPLRHLRRRQQPADALADGQRGQTGPPATSRSGSAIEPFGEELDVGLLHLLVRDARQPAARPDLGQQLHPRRQLKVERGRWICVEVMVKLNDVGDTNGEMALWLDGKPVSHLGKGFPKGKWVFDKFLPNQGGDSTRWNDKTGGREDFQTPAGGEPSKASAGAPPRTWT